MTLLYIEAYNISSCLVLVGTIVLKERKTCKDLGTKRKDTNSADVNPQPAKCICSSAAPNDGIDDSIPGPSIRILYTIYKRSTSGDAVEGRTRAIAAGGGTVVEGETQLELNLEGEEHGEGQGNRQGVADAPVLGMESDIAGGYLFYDKSYFLMDILDKQGKCACFGQI
ncbi:hypothetical protein BDN70DRAFT_898783 [Pholiota conissans]|uniref:Uncharacterized protein n=1 Tax=Pholiota conissans TaxID=109636 RepID=A0A9P5YT86_9AGAR|nr:hypothetical protein BDN70DRAFT_898783 [Pholiota conissans]